MDKNKQLLSILIAIIILQSMAILYLLLRERPPVEEEAPPPIIVEEDKEEVEEEETPEFEGLAPPELTDDMPEMFQTDDNGEFKVTWHEVEGAKRYRIYLHDKEGEEVMTVSTKGTVLYVQKIPYTGGDKPYTFYDVSLTSIDADGEEGPHGPIRELKIYKKHSKEAFALPPGEKLEAPKIKSIVTED